MKGGAAFVNRSGKHVTTLPAHHLEKTWHLYSPEFSTVSDFFSKLLLKERHHIYDFILNKHS